MSIDRDIPVTAAQIAKMAGVRPSAVSNWRRRHDDFPPPVGTGPRGGDLFSRDAVSAWLTAHGHPVAEFHAGERVFALLDRLRAAASTGQAVAMALGWLAAADALGPDETARLEEVARAGDIRMVLDDMSRATAGRFDHLWLPAREAPELARGALLECLRPMQRDERAATYEVLVRADRHSRSGIAERGTDPDLTQLLVDLAGPITGVVLDPAVGTGDLLLAAAQAAEREGHGSEVSLMGEAIHPTDAALATARLSMHGLSSDIRVEDSLAAPSFERGVADVVLCDPPLGMRLRPDGVEAGDPRWFAGTPSSSGDFAWLQHALWLTKPTSGRAIVVTGTGATFQGGRADQVRRALLNRGMIEAVIALPPGSAGPRTSIGLAVWLLRWPEANSGPRNVIFIDAARSTTKRRPLTDELRSAILECIKAGRARTALDDRGQVFVGPNQMAVSIALDDQLLAQDQTLEPRAWVGEVRADVLQYDIDALEDAFDNLMPRTLASIEDAWDDARQFAFQALSDHEVPEPHRLGDLIDDGAIELLTGTRVPSDAFVDEGLPVARAGRDSSAPRRFLDPDAAPGDLVLTQRGDVIVHPHPAGKAPMVSVTGADDEVVVYPLVALRTREAWAPPSIVAAAVSLAAEAAFANSSGASVRRVRRWMRDVAVPRLSVPAAQEVDKALRAIDDLSDRIDMASQVVEQWRVVTNGVVASGRVRIAAHPEDPE